MGNYTDGFRVVAFDNLEKRSSVYHNPALG